MTALMSGSVVVRLGVVLAQAPWCPQGLNAAGQLDYETLAIDSCSITFRRR
jgi:hypothetical protein